MSVKVQALTKEHVQQLRGEAQATHEHSIRGFLSRDPVGIEEHFSEHFSSAGGDWQFKSRDDVMHALKSGNFRYETIKSDVDTVTIASENVAIVEDRRTVKATINGKPFTSTFTNKSVLAKEGPNWKVLLWAVTC
jgi:hypothetical protein